MELISSKGYSVTPSDTVSLPELCRKLTCTGAGVASIVTGSGDTVITSLAVGIVWDGCQIKRVNATGTTATGICAFN